MNRLPAPGRHPSLRRNIACDLLRALLMGSVPFVRLVAGPRRR
ncbi:hypothetical protein ACIQWN_01370 [Streptomyces vinaceus]